VEHEGEGISSQEKFYHFLQALRAAYPNPTGDRTSYREQALALYEGVQIQEDLLAFLRAAVPALDQSPSAEPSSLEGVKNQLRLLRRVYPRVQNLQPHLGLSLYQRMRWGYEGAVLWKDLDLHQQASFPYVAFSIPNAEGGKTPFLRFSTPTRGSNRRPRLQEEFLWYLEGMEAKSKRHLYVNLQDRVPARHTVGWSMRRLGKHLGISEESPRVRLIESLGEYTQGRVSVMTLDKDSHFYHQRGRYQGAQSIKDFRGELRRQLFSNPHGGFFFSQDLLEGGMKTTCERLGDQIQSTFFSEKTQLSVEDKRVWLEIFYTLLILTVGQDFSHVNASCKDSIDRAGGTYALLYFFLLLQEIGAEGKGNFRWDLWAAVLFGPALLVKQRALFASRFQRFYEAAAFVLDSGKGLSLVS